MKKMESLPFQVTYFLLYINIVLVCNHWSPLMSVKGPDTKQSEWKDFRLKIRKCRQNSLLLKSCFSGLGGRDLQKQYLTFPTNSVSHILCYTSSWWSTFIIYNQLIRMEDTTEKELPNLPFTTVSARMERSLYQTGINQLFFYCTG